MGIGDPVYAAPSANMDFRDQSFPSGDDPAAEGVDPASPVTFDLTEDQPDNVITDGQGGEERFGTFERTPASGAIVRLYGDLKRHEMGPLLAEPPDGTGRRPSSWITKELWGVGSTAPYLHDGSATTLGEAILAHGGEAAAARDAFEALSADGQRDLIAS